jgi:magnesium transporter
MALIEKRSRKSGMAPGSLVYVGEQKVEKTKISLIDYGPDKVTETSPENWSECQPYLSSESVTWINVTGLGDSEQLAQIGQSLGIHSLVLEDILNTGHRPKVEDHEDYVFIILKMLYQIPEDRWMTSEQVSLILGRGFVISFQEIEGDVFEPIRKRINTVKSRLRNSASDYLAYALIDAVVDHCFIILEELGDRIEILQDKVLLDADTESLVEIHNLKQMMVLLRKGVLPLREVAGKLQSLDSELVSEELTPYLRDAYEHSIQVVDITEMLRDLLSSTLDTYMTVMSNRMNRTMHILTVIATIFIPLTFLVGVYGMNFQFMPELGWKYGYAAFWGLTVGLGVGMAIYFRRKIIS